MTDAHVFADKEDAAERYLLGQMSESDRDAYEQHFFQCVKCADEVLGHRCQARGRALGAPGQFGGAGHESLDPPVRGDRFVQRGR